MTVLSPGTEYGGLQQNTRQAWGSRDPIGVATIRRGVFHSRPLHDPLDGLLPGSPAIASAGYTATRKHGHTAATPFTSSPPHSDVGITPVVRRALSTAVADHGHLPATGTPARKPLVLLPSGIASSAGTWDKYDHTRCEGASWSRTRPRHTSPRRRFRSYVSDS